MAATSTEGTGVGSALKSGYRGSEGVYLGTEHLVGAGVVLTGSTTLSSGAGTVTFGTTLPGVDADYIVLCGQTAAISYASSVTVNGFTLTGTGSQVVKWVVIRITGATVTVSA